MKNLILILFFVVLGTTAKSQGMDYCQVFGSVHVTDQRQFADYVIFIEEDENYAEVNVFKENNQFFADKAGMWHMVENRAFADHIVYITDNRGGSDFSVYFTDVAAFAGCR